MKTPSRLLFSFAILSSISVCRAEKWKRAEIRLLDWDVQTFRRLDPADIKDGFKHTFTDDAQEFADSLGLDKLTPAKKPHPEDARLVIDLTTEKGQVVTYYASRINLCTADNNSKRPIDEAFRKRFTDLSRNDTAKGSRTGGAIVDGPNYAFTIAAPKGWKMISTPEFQAAFHPADKTFADSAVVMYARSGDKKELKISKIEEMNLFDLKGIQEHSPAAKSEKAGTVKIASGKEIPVYSFRYDSFHELVAYADEARTITVFAISADSAELLKSSRAAFDDLVASYTFIGDVTDTKDKPEKPKKKAKDRAK